MNSTTSTLSTTTTTTDMSDLCLGWILHVSSSFSFISGLSWVFAQLPQIVTNYKLKSAEGISPSFLLLWFLGDFLSFTSCLLNDATLNFQLYLSIFFLCNDITLCFQYYYYNSVYPRTTAFESYTPVDILPQPVVIHKDLDEHGEEREIRQLHEQLLSDESAPSSYNSTDENKSIMKNLAGAIAVHAGRANAFANDAMLDNAQLYTLKDSVGLALAWGCTIVYCASRCPQLYKNYKRKSADGILPLLFGAALLGNLTYTLSILTSCSFIFGDDRSEFFYKELPYILGSSGTILFDLAYFYQKRLYNNSKKQTNTFRLQPWSDIESSSA